MASPVTHLSALGLPSDMSRIVVAVAHPDDETIGAGGLLAAGAPFLDLHVIHLTDGAPRDGHDPVARSFPSWQSYAARRRAEAAAALCTAGLPLSRWEGFGYADQQAMLHMAALARRMAQRLATLAPEVVLTHPYEGGHPDHDAASFAVHAACALLARAGRPVPAVVEMASYHNGGGTRTVQDFLPDGGRPVIAVELTALQRRVKARMMAVHRSQARRLVPFRVEVERFRRATPPDFTRPPHEGPLLYETWGAGLTGARWRALAGRALTDLGLE